MNVYTVKQVAEILQCDTETVRNYIRKDKLEASKLGNRYRITEEDLKKFLQNQKGKVQK